MNTSSPYLESKIIIDETSVICKDIDSVLKSI